MTDDQQSSPSAPPRCQAVAKATGEACRMQPLKGREHCLKHDPALKKYNAAQAREAGAASHATTPKALRRRQRRMAQKVGGEQSFLKLLKAEPTEGNVLLARQALAIGMATGEIDVRAGEG